MGNGQKTLVPTKVLSPILREYLDRHIAEDGLAPVEYLAFQCGLNIRTMFAILHEEREAVQFNTADLLICKTVGPWAWYNGPLAEYYLPMLDDDPPKREKYRKKKRKPTAYNLSNPVVDELGLVECGWSKCKKRFPYSKGRWPGARYCCKAHAANGRNERKGEVRTKQAQETRRRLVRDACPAGHRRTVENTYVYRNPNTGKEFLKCRECAAESARNLRKRRKKKKVRKKLATG